MAEPVNNSGREGHTVIETRQSAAATAPRPSKAERQKRWRQRQATGLGVVQVTVPVYEVAEALIEAGRISVADAIDRRVFAHALSEVIVDWAQHWRE